MPRSQFANRQTLKSDRSDSAKTQRVRTGNNTAAGVFPETEQSVKLSAEVAQKRPSELTPAQVLGLQRVVGNRAVARMIKASQPRTMTVCRKTAPKSGTNGTVQRAIGFEFEFGKWQTTHNDEEKTRLTKGEEIIKGSGYKVEGEDSENGSAIEIVTKPYTTVGEAVGSINQAQEKLKGMHEAGENVGHSATPWGGTDHVIITPKGAAGKMQASPAIALDKITALYAKQAAIGGGKGKALGESVKGQVDKLQEKYLGDSEASPELIGLVTLIVDYLEQGSGKGNLSYPKSAYKLMARTSFNKMFELVPEFAFFAKPENIEKWVNLVLEVSANIFGNEFYDEDTTKDNDEQVQVPKTFLGFKSIFGKKLGTKTKTVRKTIPWKERKSRSKSIEQMGSEPVIGQKLGDIEALPGDKPTLPNEPSPSYHLTLTRDEWLRNMTTEDKLSKSNDKRFEGMGAYGGAMDVEEPPPSIDVVKPEIENATSNAVSKLDLDTISSPKESGSTEPKGEQPKPKQAPLFEFRGMKDMFGIEIY